MSSVPSNVKPSTGLNMPVVLNSGTESSAAASSAVYMTLAEYVSQWGFVLDLQKSEGSAPSTSQPPALSSGSDPLPTTEISLDTEISASTSLHGSESPDTTAAVTKGPKPELGPLEGPPYRIVEPAHLYYTRNPVQILHELESKQVIKLDYRFCGQADGVWLITCEVGILQCSAYSLMRGEWHGEGTTKAAAKKEAAAKVMACGPIFELARDLYVRLK